MKILILTKVPAEYEKYRKKGQDLPSFQAQAFWKKTLKEMGHKVFIIKYSDPIFLSTNLSSKIELLLNQLFPKVWQKIRLLKNKFYYLLPQNYIRTNKITPKIDKENFDLIILSGGCSNLVPSIFKNFKNKVILLHGENPITSATKFEKDCLPYIHAIITNDKLHAINWKKLGAKKSIAIPYTGIDPKTHKKLKLNRNIDLLFIGSLFKERQEQLLSILDFSPHIYGFIPESIGLHPKLKKYYKGEAWGNKVVRLYNQSKIAINFVPRHMKVGGNTRTFRIPACGALQIANKCPNEWFEDKKEIIIFNSTKDLKTEIKNLLNDPKKLNQIAIAGHKKAHQKHTYKKRFISILSI